MMLVALNISSQNADRQQFDALEVWRSMELLDGPYAPLTSSGGSPARLPPDAPDPPAITQLGPRVNANSKRLFLMVTTPLGVTPLTITIVDTDPTTYSVIATQIMAQDQSLLTAYVVGDLLVVETMAIGSGMQLVATGGDIAGLTGLRLNEPSFGLDPYIPLITGQDSYTINDPQGTSTSWYEWRLRNSLTHAVGEFSAPFQPLPPVVADAITGYVDLTDMDGTALEAREVRIYSRFNGQLANGRVVAGYSKNALTDAYGHIEFMLVRGLPFTIAIAGTNLVRDLVVPTDPTVTSFNMLDPLLGTNDVFKVQIPNIPYATRRSF